MRAKIKTVKQSAVFVFYTEKGQNTGQNLKIMLSYIIDL